MTFAVIRLAGFALGIVIGWLVLRITGMIDDARRERQRIRSFRGVEVSPSSKVLRIYPGESLRISRP